MFMIHLYDVPHHQQYSQIVFVVVLPCRYNLRSISSSATEVVKVCIISDNSSHVRMGCVNMAK
jgi:hypothetical protein